MTILNYVLVMIAICVLVFVASIFFKKINVYKPSKTAVVWKALSYSVYGVFFGSKILELVFYKQYLKFNDAFKLFDRSLLVLSLIIYLITLSILIYERVKFTKKNES